MNVKRIQKTDNIISLSILIQSVLVLIQQSMIDIIGMAPEDTTMYRVIFSALPMSIAILLSLKRNIRKYFFTYIFTFLILLFNYYVFPDNRDYLISNSIRFLLPMVIASALCTISISSLEIFEKNLYRIGWVSFVIVFVYFLLYILEFFQYSGYNMSFSYGCLLPMIGLYRRKSILSILASLFLFIVVVSIGSRGAAMIFFAYVIYDLATINKRYIMLLIVFISLFILFIPFLVEYLDSIGIQSRTLLLYEMGDLGRDSGRSYLYSIFINLLIENPFGLGLFGDRPFLDGYYCHNIVLELIINWGIFGSLILLVFYLTILAKLYNKSNKYNKNRIICYTVTLIGPLMASGSYLIEPNVGIYLGLLYLINKNNKQRQFAYNKMMQLP